MAPHTSSGILNDGLFFAVTRYGVMTCYDAVTGKRQWRVRLGGRSFAASLVIGDGKIYVTAESGTTSVVAASRKFELLGENFLERGHSSSPAIADGSILLRTEGNLFRIGSGGAEPLPTQTASPSE